MLRLWIFKYSLPSSKLHPRHIYERHFSQISAILHKAKCQSQFASISSSSCIDLHARLPPHTDLFASFWRYTSFSRCPRDFWPSPAKRDRPDTWPSMHVHCFRTLLLVVSPFSRFGSSLIPSAPPSHLTRAPSDRLCWSWDLNGGSGNSGMGIVMLLISCLLETGKQYNGVQKSICM